ncbi:MAG: hypothetical protein GY861_21310 [bacterium]|nr:hypothetical protein [bacterium]
MDRRQDYFISYMNKSGVDDLCKLSGISNSSAASIVSQRLHEKMPYYSEDDLALRNRFLLSRLRGKSGNLVNFLKSVICKNFVEPDPQSLKYCVPLSSVQGNASLQSKLRDETATEEFYEIGKDKLEEFVSCIGPYVLEFLSSDRDVVVFGDALTERYKDPIFYDDVSKKLMGNWQSYFSSIEKKISGFLNRPVYLRFFEKVLMYGIPEDFYRSDYVHRIFVNAYPSVGFRVLRGKLQSVCGYALSGDFNCFSFPEATGDNSYDYIYDEDSGNVIAVAKHGALYILVDIMQSDNPTKLFEVILDNYLSCLSDSAGYRLKALEKMLDLFARGCISGYVGRYSRESSTMIAEINSLQAKLKGLLTRYNLVQKLLSSASPDVVIREVKNGFNSISNPLIKGIRPYPLHVDIITDLITIKYLGYEYVMGTYCISVFADRVSALARYTVTDKTKLQHPHIAPDGNICYGNIAGTVDRLVSDNRYDVLVILVLDFLTSYNRSDAFGDISLWPRMSNYKSKVASGEIKPI